MRSRSGPDLGRVHLLDPGLDPIRSRSRPLDHPLLRLLPPLRQTPEALEANINEVKRALLDAGLPFGAKASCPQKIDFYPFHHDQKNCKKFWDVRKVRRGAGCDVPRGLHPDGSV